MPKEEHLIMYGNCIPVKGKKRSIIYDLQRSNFEIIPNSLYTFLIECKTKNLKEISKELDHSSKPILKEYLDFLIKKEFAFIGQREEIGLFPSLNNDWDEPFLFTNVLIDIKKESDTESIFSFVEKITTDSIQFRFFDHISKNKLSLFLNNLKKIDSNSFQILLPYSYYLESSYLIELALIEPRLNFIYLHNSPVDKNETLVGFVRLIQTKKAITNCLFCGIIQPAYFAINIKSFTESQHHNTCLNRKISIDVNGDIKNCPSMPESYGNIKDTTLQEALEHPDFKKYWNIKKDEITKCKDCEFRHICTDCRAYRDDPEDIYSAPLKCGYDPYTGKWEEWSTNPLKQKAIDFHEMREIL